MEATLGCFPLEEVWTTWLKGSMFFLLECGTVSKPEWCSALVNRPQVAGALWYAQQPECQPQSVILEATGLHVKMLLGCG